MLKGLDQITVISNTIEIHSLLPILVDLPFSVKKRIHKTTVHFDAFVKEKTNCLYLCVF